MHKWFIDICGVYLYAPFCVLRKLLDNGPQGSNRD